jgi:hypothetical protein
MLRPTRASLFALAAMSTRMSFNRSKAVIAAALVTSAVAWVSAQAPQVFQFVVSASDASGMPVTDLRPEDVVMSENGVSQPVIKLEPLAIPMKLTIAVDNGVETADVLAHYRTGLTGLVEALPPDVEVTLIAIAGQPRTVVRPTTDRKQILRGIDTFAPEQTGPRFSDALVEYSERLQRETKDRKLSPYLPVLLMVSTAATDKTNYQPKDIEKAVAALVTRRARFNAVMVSTHPGDVATAAALSSSLQGIIAAPAARATNGRYETLSVPSRLITLLSEWGRDLAALHTRQIKQFRVTVERSQGGDLRNPRIELARPGLTGTVTRDGYLP